jgi:CrcB protein
MIKNILLVGVGGGIGSILRYLCQKWVLQLYPSGFPLGTFLVNIIGCFLIGVFFAAAEKTTRIPAEWRLFLTTGICGGFTTFSAFAFENMNLLREGNISVTLLYVIGSVVLGILAVFAGAGFVKVL